MTSDLPLHIQQAKFRLHIHLASKGRNSPRETGNPAYLPEMPESPNNSAPEASHRVTDKRHLWYQEREDYQLEQSFTSTRPKRSKITPLVIENLVVWSTVIAAAWWLMTR